jgi:sugar transferase (PEP-CTERM/EpsH1 system associated)
MRILWIKMGGLWPLNTGGRQRSFHIVRELARRHDITLLTTDGEGDEPEGLAAQLPKTVRTESVAFEGARRGTAAFAAALCRSWLTPDPVGVSKWRSSEASSRVRALSADHDLIVADFLFSVPNITFDGPPVVFFAHNVEHMIWRRYCALEKRAWRRALLEVEWRKFRRAEARACARAALTIAVSDEDARALQSLAPDARVVSVPTGVDLEYFSPQPVAEKPSDLVFCGSMDWSPNEDAVCWFADAILPRVRAARPDVTFTIVGRRPGPRVRALGERPGIVVTGSVDDVRPYVAAAAVSIVPLRIGGGTRIKIFEACGMARPVLSTSIGAEGLHLVPDRQIAIADTAEAFADAAVALLAQPDRRHAMGRAGRAVVEERYGWSRIGDEFSQRLERVRPHAHLATRRPALP